jgi:hypothetical protein
MKLDIKIAEQKNLTNIVQLDAMHAQQGLYNNYGHWTVTDA